jgi:hypothetical protein
VTYVSPFLDAKTRTAEVRLELPNPEGRLKPEMFANVMIQADPREDVTAIPSEAIIRSGRRTLAIVALGEGRFAPREIELGLETGEGWTEITQGLRPGETVVVSSQFLIDSESKLQEAIQKLLTADAQPAEPPEPQGQGAAPPHVHEHTPVDPPAMSPMHHAPQPPDPPEEHHHHHPPTSPSAEGE